MLTCKVGSDPLSYPREYRGSARDLAGCDLAICQCCAGVFAARFAVKPNCVCGHKVSLIYYKCEEIKDESSKA